MCCYFWKLHWIKTQFPTAHFSSNKNQLEDTPDKSTASSERNTLDSVLGGFELLSISIVSPSPRYIHISYSTGRKRPRIFVTQLITDLPCFLSFPSFPVNYDYFLRYTDLWRWRRGFPSNFSDTTITLNFPPQPSDSSTTSWTHWIDR